MTLEERFLKEYEENADSLFRFCLFKLSSREDAKDLLQETFTKTWAYLSSGGEIENHKAFLFKTARNLIIDKYRKKKTDSLDQMTEYGFDPPYEENTSVEERMDADMALKLLTRLPDDYREVIMLKFLEELSIREIADALNESPGNISVKLHRAMSKLRKIYKELENKENV
jgi:RNA polymerase sigma-70 factor, ECF subfamily